MRRPYVILNAAMTVDGKISSIIQDSKISCEEDLDRVHRIRSEVDGIMVGIGTVLSDDPQLTVRRIDGRNPTRIIVDSRGRIPLDAKVLDGSAPTVVAVSEKINPKNKKKLKSSGAETILVGREKVDLKALLETLKERGMKSILLEGGSTLNWSMLKDGLVDEIRIAIHPCIVGGRDAKTLVGGSGAEKIEEGLKLNLKNIEKVGGDLLLVYDLEDSSYD